MLIPQPIPLPVKAKLVDDEVARKLLQRMQEVKQSYRPEQGWLDCPTNEVKRA